MIYIGIDPGKKGAIAWLENGCQAVWPYSNEMLVQICKEAMEAIEHEQKVIVCVEKVGAMPGQGVTSMFNFGKSAGFIEGVLQAYGIPYQLITPQKWKKEFSLGSDKKQSIEVCKRLFPDISLRRTDKCRTDDDGMAEALLMAEYARRHF